MGMGEWEKRSIPQVKFGKDHNNPTITGVYVVIREAGETAALDGGEVKTRHQLVMKNPKTGEKFWVWANVGLQTAIQNAGVTAGEEIKIDHLGLVPLATKPGQKVNQYEVYSKGVPSGSTT